MIRYLSNDDQNKQKNQLINDVWVDFWEIYIKIKKNMIDSPNMKQDTVNWIEKFKLAYNEEHITPYMHAFVHHFHQFIDLHGDINMYNEQGIEKLNDLTTSQFYRNTNKKKFIRQLINLRNRLEILEKNEVDE